MSIVNDALNRSKRILADKLIPEYKTTGQSRNTENSSLWNRNITNTQLIEAYKENGIGRKLVAKIAKDTFDKWFNVVSDKENLIEEVNVFFAPKKSWYAAGDKTNLGLKKYLKEGYKVAMVEGYALLMLGFSDDAPLETEVENPRSLDYLSVIPRSVVRKLIIEQDSGSEHYGEIVGAMVKMGKGTPVEVHASRFIYMPVNLYGNDPEGIGYMRPAYNFLTVLDNVIWSTGQAFYRNAAGFLHYIKKGGKSDQLKKMKTQAKNTNAITAWVSDPSTEIKDVGVRKSALNPVQYWDVALKAVAMSFDVPVQIAEGVAAGEVTGSETNLRDYYSDISSKQEIDFTPVIETLIAIGQKTGQISEGESNIIWNPLLEMNKKEEAEINKLNAETEKIRIDSGVLDAEEVKKKLELALKTDCVVVKTDQTVPDFEYDDRTNLNASEVEELEQDYSDDLASLFKTNELMKAIKNNEVDVVAGEGILGDDFNDLERELSAIEKSKGLKVKEVVDKNIDASWTYGWTKSENFLDLNIIASEKAVQIRKILKQSNYVFVNSLGNDVTKKTLFAVQESVLAGEGIPIIRKKVEKIVDVAKSRANTIARTETHRAMTQAIKQSYRDSGEVKEVEYITAGDEAVRQTHADLDGRIFPLNNTPPELEDINCRCTVVAHFGGR